MSALGKCIKDQNDQKGYESHPNVQIFDREFSKTLIF